MASHHTRMGRRILEFCVCVSVAAIAASFFSNWIIRWDPTTSDAIGASNLEAGVWGLFLGACAWSAAITLSRRLTNRISHGTLARFTIALLFIAAAYILILEIALRRAGKGALFDTTIEEQAFFSEACVMAAGRPPNCHGKDPAIPIRSVHERLLRRSMYWHPASVDLRLSLADYAARCESTDGPTCA